MIRQAGRDDLAAVTACVEPTFGPYREETGGAPAPLLAGYGLLVGRGSVQLLEDAGELLGLIVLEPCPDHLSIETLAVLPEHQP